MNRKWLWGALVAVGLGGLAVAGWTAADARCSQSCYQAKSQAYQRCRAIPPTDREARNACFRRADAALERCLATCT